MVIWVNESISVSPTVDAVKHLKTISNAGGIKVVIKAMRTHKENGDVLLYGPGILFFCSEDNDDLKTIAKEGGIEVILKAKEHISNGGLQWKVCFALYYLGRKSIEEILDHICTQTRANDEERKRIVKEGGIKVILDAMDKYQENGDVQENGCGTLVNLACDDDNKKTIAKEGGINVILDAMKRHKKNEYVQTYGRDALSNLLGV